jgi:hypothetical protein
MTISGIAPGPTTTARYYAGQIVVDTVSGTTYEVENHAQKNVRAKNAAGQVWRIGPGRLRLATEAESRAFRDSKVETTFFYAGNVVRFKGTGPKTPQGLWVVTKETPNGYNLVRLGGDNTGRYYRSVSASSIEKADVADLAGIQFVNV